MFSLFKVFRISENVTLNALIFKTLGRLTSEKQFRDLLIREDNTGIVRLSDVARVELAPETLEQGWKYNGVNAVGIVIIPQPGANNIEIANDFYEKLEVMTERLVEGLEREAREKGIPHQINQVGSMWTLFFTKDPVYDLDTAKKSDTKRFAQFFWAMMDRGIYLPCSQFEAAFTSAVHRDQDIANTIQAARDSFAILP